VNFFSLNSSLILKDIMFLNGVSLGLLLKSEMNKVYSSGSTMFTASIKCVDEDDSDSI
jgi:hypothetical protein